MLENLSEAQFLKERAESDAEFDRQFEKMQEETGIRVYQTANLRVDSNAKKIVKDAAERLKYPPQITIGYLPRFLPTLGYRSMVNVGMYNKKDARWKIKEWEKTNFMAWVKGGVDWENMSIIISTAAEYLGGMTDDNFRSYKQMLDDDPDAQLSLPLPLDECLERYHKAIDRRKAIQQNNKSKEQN